MKTKKKYPKKGNVIKSVIAGILKGKKLQMQTIQKRKDMVKSAALQVYKKEGLFS